MLALGIWGLAVIFAINVAGCGRSDPPPLEQRMAVPAYWTPALPEGRAEFARLELGVGPGSMVVINGSHSAPETPRNEAWARTFAQFKRVGARTLGYVDSGYLGVAFGTGSHATRPQGAGRGARTVEAWMAQITTDIDDWYALYGADGIGGIFVDQTVATCGPLDEYVQAYQRISTYIKQRHPGAYVVMNPGQAIEPCYRDVADTFVTFEGPYSQYLHRTAPKWEASAPAGKFWHLVYAAPGVAAMSHAVALSKRRNARYVYVTNGLLSTDGLIHPWDAIPPDGYWQAEVTTVLNRPFPSLSTN